MLCIVLCGVLPLLDNEWSLIIAAREHASLFVAFGFSVELLIELIKNERVPCSFYIRETYTRPMPNTAVAFVGIQAQIQICLRWNENKMQRTAGRIFQLNTTDQMMNRRESFDNLFSISKKTGEKYTYLKLGAKKWRHFSCFWQLWMRCHHSLAPMNNAIHFD